MSFLSGIGSGLGNIFHSIGSLFDGGDDEQKKRQQQQQQQQQSQAQSQGPGLNLPSSQNNQDNTPPPPQKLNLLGDNPLDSSSLQKAKPLTVQPTAPQPQLSVQPTPTQPTVKVNPTPAPASVSVTSGPADHPHPSFLTKVKNYAINTGADLAKDVLGDSSAGETPQVAQAAAQAQRAGQPLPQIASDQAGHEQSATDQALNAIKARLFFAAPAKAVGESALRAASNIGKIGAAYQGADSLTSPNTQGRTPVQVAENTAEQVAAGYAGGSVLGLGGNLLVKAGSRLLGKAKDFLGGAPAKAPDEVATGVKSANPEPTPAQPGPSAVQPSPHVIDTRPPEAPAITPIDQATHAKASQDLAQQYDVATKQAENMPPIRQKQFLDNLEQQTQAKQQELDNALAAGNKQPVDTLSPRTSDGTAGATTPPELGSGVPPEILQSKPAVPAESPSNGNASSLPNNVPQTPNIVNSPTVTPATAAQAVAEGKPVVPATDANGNPALVSDITAARQAEAAGVSPNQVPVAPRTREAAMKQLGDMAKQIPGDGKFRDVTNLDDLANSARGAVENMPPNELVSLFNGTSSDLPHDAKGFAMLRAARDRLSQLSKQDPGNGDIKTAIGNVIDEMASRSSEGGLLQRVVQEEFDAMPIEAKVSYLAKKIDQANQHVEGYEPLRSRPEVLAEIDAGLTARLQASEDVAGQVAALGNQLDQAAEAAARGQKVDVKGLAKQMQAKQEELLAKNGEVVKYFQSLVPGRSGPQKALVDLPKRMMLASFTGRVNDLVTTANNVGELQVRNLVQGGLAKAYNLVKGPGAVTDTSRGLTKVVSGLRQGLQRFKGEAGGKQYVGDLQKSVKGNEDLRSNLRQPSGPVGRTVQAAVELATHASRGVRNQRLYQLADQEAAKAGLKGAMRRQYAEARSANPSRQMIQNAEQVHLEVNNLNDNPISRTLYKVGQALEGDNKFGRTGIGGVIKNQIIPFTSWLGGNIWNQVTDRNVIAHTFKFVRAAAKGDPEKAIQNLGAGITDAAVAYGVGYQLANMGVLTDKNAEGYNDGGLYVHAGGRYIPVGILGFFAPNIVLGKAAHDGLNPPEGKSAIGAMVDTIGGYAWNGLALGSALGVENTLSRAYQSATRPGGSAADAGAVAGSSVAGQFIPGVTGDINAVLDQTGLNPTHEAANTKVQSDKLLKSGKQSQAKDVVKSAGMQLENRIPGLSQTLPRKADVAAKDLIDRVVKGDRDTAGSIKAAQVKQTQADLSKADKAADIPDPKGTYTGGDSFDSAVQARIDRGEYDKAITALQQKLDTYKGDNNVAKKTTDDLQNHIKELGVTKTYGSGGQDMRKLYLKTSLSEWRAMGDPEGDSYDPATYQKLYSYDSALAKQGVADASTDSDKNKYTAKKASGKATRARADKLVKDNTIGSLPELKNVSFGNLAPAKISNVKIPTIGTLKPEELIKKRAISVSKV